MIRKTGNERVKSHWTILFTAYR